MRIRTMFAAVARRAALTFAVATVTIVALGALAGGGAQAADAPPAGPTAELALQAAPDEGGTGVNNFDREEWFEFSIMLAPFLVLVTFILILIFKWDSHAGIGEDED